MTAILYLLRHAQAAPAGILLGQCDLPLLPEGELQADSSRARLAHIPFTFACCSPLLRARQTAQRILQDRQPSLPLHTLFDLREISLGAWDGQSKHWVQQHYPQEWEARGKDMANNPPPQGESYADLARRVVPAFTKVCEQARQHPASLLVAHQAVNRVIIAHLQSVPLAQLNSIAQPACALTRIQIDGQACIIDADNFLTA